MAEEQEEKGAGVKNPLKSIPKDKRGLVVAGGIAAVIVVYAWWRNSQVSSDASEAAMDAAYADDGYITQATPGDLGYSTGTTAGESSSDSSYTGLPTLKSNPEWVQYAVEQLAAAGSDSSTVQSALGKYLDRQQLTATEQDVVRRALAAAGPPPVGSYTIVPAIEAPAPSALAAPTGLKSTKVTSTTVDLSWNKVTGAGNYRIYRSGASQNVGASYDNVAQVGGLQPNTSYTFTVAAGQAGSESVGPKSAPLTVRTSAPSVGTPGTPSASQITKNSVYLTWGTVKGATGYRIYREGISEPIGHSVDGKYRISGLSANTTYRFAVAAMVGSTTGKKSGWRSAKTKK